MRELHPVEELMGEHRLIERVLDAMEARLNEARSAGFPAEFFEQALDFFVNFADGRHHYKEEQALFPVLREKGVPVEGGPIGVMLHEHEQGRACLKGIRESLPAARAGSADAVEAIFAYAAEYVQMLRRHIWKEDNVLFRMASQMLTSAEVEGLKSRFGDESNPQLADEARGRYDALVNKLTIPAQERQ